MRTNLYFTTGKLFFGITILALGIIHIITGNFPTGLLPVPASLPGRTILVYLSGAAIIIAGVLIFVKKITAYGALLAAAIFLVFFLALHVPLLIANIKNGSEWTGTFEVFSLISGALLVAGIELTTKNNSIGNKLTAAGKYMFAIALFVFGMLHFEYEDFIVTLIPAWIPFIVFWSYVVMAGFFLVFISLVTQVWVQLSSLFFALMFLLWVLILHLPLVVTHIKVEPQWSSMFIALGTCGIGLLIAGSVTYSPEKSRTY